jgi:hypothetical protein
MAISKCFKILKICQNGKLCQNGNSTQFNSNASSDVCVGTGVLTAVGGESLEWSNGVL